MKFFPSKIFKHYLHEFTMGKGNILGVLFILAILIISGYAMAQDTSTTTNSEELSQGAAKVDQRGTMEKYDLSYWKITFNFDKKYFSEFGLVKNPTNFSVYMKCSLESPYIGSCVSMAPADFTAKKIKLSDPSGNLHDCELPLKFSLLIRPRTSNNQIIKADSIINQCVYFKSGNSCSLQFMDCYAPSFLGTGFNRNEARVRTMSVKIPGQESYTSDLPVKIEGGKLKLKIKNLIKNDRITGKNVIIKPTVSWSAERIASIPGVTTTVSGGSKLV